MAIPRAEVRNPEFYWNSKFQIAENGQDLAFGIPNSELLPLESPWQFHEQNFGIGIYMDRSLGPYCIVRNIS